LPASGPLAIFSFLIRPSAQVPIECFLQVFPISHFPPRHFHRGIYSISLSSRRPPCHTGSAPGRQPCVFSGRDSPLSLFQRFLSDRPRLPLSSYPDVAIFPSVLKDEGPPVFLLQSHQRFCEAPGILLPASFRSLARSEFCLDPTVNPWSLPPNSTLPCLGQLSFPTSRAFSGVVGLRCAGGTGKT